MSTLSSSAKVASQSAAQETYWELAPDLIIEPIEEDGWAVFHVRYWDSTVVGVVDHALLQSLDRAGRAIRQSDLIGSVALSLDVTADDALRQYCREALRQMVIVGLVYEASAR